MTFVSILLIYSLIGAILEHLSYYIYYITGISRVKKVLANPILTGFPVYGIAAYFILAFHKMFNLNTVTSFIIFGILLTLYEYIIGIFVDAGKTENGQVDSWDYSALPFNYKGIISIRHAFYWGILAVLLINIHSRIALLFCK